MPTGFKSALDGKEFAVSTKELRKRFAADIGESTSYDSVPYATMRTPSTKSLFGSKINDRELLFAVQREPAAFRIDFGVAVVDDVLYAVGGYSYTSYIYGMVTPVVANEQYIPMGYGIPPEIKILSPLNQWYNESSVSLIFGVEKPVNWTGYSLDGQDNVTISGNGTVTDLSNGLHNVTIYATDTFGNMGASQTISFTIAVPEPFPVVPLVAAGLLVYLKKRKLRVANSLFLPGKPNIPLVSAIWVCGESGINMPCR